MIKDKLLNSELYFNISDNLKKGFEWLADTDLNNIKSGKYLIDSDKLYANVQEYETKDDADFEAHNKYIDIQCVINGAEKVAVSDRQLCKTVKSYNSDNDVEFLTSNNSDWLILNEGDFLVLFPNDAHKPCIKLNERSLVKKVVVKVAVD